jgi:(S)-mandelate dehydrogenase
MSKVRAANSIAEIRTLAQKRVPRAVFDLADTGAGDGSGLRRNIDLLRAHRLWPRVLTAPEQPDQSCVLFGRRYDSPFGISATGMAGLFWPHADLLLAEAAAAANIPFILSTCSSDGIADVARLAPGNVWFQLYPSRDPGMTDQMVGRARDAGVDVLVMTVDWPVAPRFETASIARSSWRAERLRAALTRLGWVLRYLRSGVPFFANWQPFAPERATPAEIQALAASQWPCAQSWDDVARIRDLWPGKLVLKGIAHPDDARHAHAIGADGVTISNHGGKAHARFPATTEMLPAIKAAIGDDIVVLADGGIEHGADICVLKCLGADFSFFGRIALYGVAAGGRDGIERVIALIRQDVNDLLRQLGSAGFDGLDARYLHNRALEDSNGVIGELR